jgi:hypothetical protein
MPKDFFNHFKIIADKYKSERVGSALDISDHEKMYTYQYPAQNFPGIYQSQLQYWGKKMNDDIYELYDADIDTTLCLVTKSFKHLGLRIRVAGEYTVKHIPWYPEYEGFSWYSNYLTYKNMDIKISSIKRLVMNYMNDNHIIPIKKNREVIIVKDDFSFWLKYNHWKCDLFAWIDNHVSQDTEFLNIGGEFGEVSIYASRKAKKVVTVENDKNIKLNRLDIPIIVDSEIDFKNLIQKHQLNNVVIYMNLKGKEENLIKEIYEYCQQHHCKAYIELYYENWINDWHQYSFLTESTSLIIDQFS